MSIVVIKATVDCDGCGKQFHAEMDNADKLPEGWSIHDLATDYVRGGNCAEGGMSSVQHDMHLCPQCTVIADSIGEESHKPSREEIVDAIEEAGLKPGL